MNIKNLMYLAGGALIGAAGSWVTLEDRISKKYQEMAALNRRAYERASLFKTPSDENQMEIDFNASETSFDSDELEHVKEIGGIKLHSMSLDKEINAFGEGITLVEPAEELTAETVKNDYHRAIEAVETPIETFVEGGVNNYGISYLEEEEYEDEDGRVKLKMDIMMDEHNPIFMMDGEPVDDWSDRVGESILIDMFSMCPPNLPAILYVRNHRTDEDYEVVRVEVT